MDFTFSADQEALRSAVRAFMTRLFDATRATLVESPRPTEG